MSNMADTYTYYDGMSVNNHPDFHHCSLLVDCSQLKIEKWQGDTSMRFSTLRTNDKSLLLHLLFVVYLIVSRVTLNVDLNVPFDIVGINDVI